MLHVLLCNPLRPTGLPPRARPACARALQAALAGGAQGAVREVEGRAREGVRRRGRGSGALPELQEAPGAVQGVWK